MILACSKTHVNLAMVQKKSEQLVISFKYIPNHPIISVMQVIILDAHLLPYVDSHLPERLMVREVEHLIRVPDRLEHAISDRVVDPSPVSTTPLAHRQPVPRNKLTS